MTRLIWLSFVLVLVFGAWRAATPQANADNKLSVYMTYVDPNDGHPVQRGMGVAFELIIDNETGTRCYALPGAINCVKGDR